MLCADFPFLTVSFSCTMVCACHVVIICIDLPPPLQGEAAARAARKAQEQRISAEQTTAMANAERADLLANYKAVCKELREAQERLHTQQVIHAHMLRDGLRKARVSFPFCSLLVHPFEVVHSFVSSYGTLTFKRRR